MSDRMFQYAKFSQKNVDTIIGQWSEVCDEQGMSNAIIGFMQLVLDRLRLSCHNLDTNDFELPGIDDLDTFDMDTYLSEKTKNQIFIYANQKKSDEELALLFMQFIMRSDEMPWMQHIQKFLRSLLINSNTALLVSKTIILLYTTSVMRQNEQHVSQEFKVQLQETSQFLSTTIREDDIDVDVLERMIDELFDQMHHKPNIIRYDVNGCTRIIAKFLDVKDTIVNTSVLTEIIDFYRENARGNELIQICCSEEIVSHLSYIIVHVKGIKVQTLALTLACIIKEMDPRIEFDISVYQDCIRSDNISIRQLVAKLTSLTLRRSNSETANPADILIRAVEFHQHFRQDYGMYAKRLIDTFYNEFTNTEAVFQVIQLRLPDQAFIDEIWWLLRLLYDRVKKDTDEVKSEHLKRSFLHSTIDFLSNINRRYDKTCGGFLYMITFVDSLLELVDTEHLFRLATFVTEVSLDYFSTYSGQLNAIVLFSRLVNKGYIQDDIRRAKIDQCVKNLNGLHSKLQENLDFDKEPDVLQALNNACVFVSQKMAPEYIVQLCKQSYEFIVNGELDLTKNRTFLAYTLNILVDTVIELYAKSAPNTPTEIQDICRNKIFQMLLDILKKTEDDFDFLCVMAFWCLAKMDTHFKSLSTAENVKILEKYMVKKVNLVEIMPRTGTNMEQLEYVRYMLDKFKMMMVKGTVLDVRDLVLSLQKRFPSYDMDKGLIKICVNCYPMNNVARFVTDILEEYRTKKLKEGFLKMVEDFLNPLEDQQKDNIRNRIIRMGMNKFGKRAQEQHDEIWQKKARTSAKALNNVILQNLPLGQDKNC